MGVWFRQRIALAAAGSAMMAMGLMGAPPASASPNPAAQARANVERLSIGSALGELVKSSV